MAAPDQMNREELLKAKERVEQQLERLNYRTVGFPSVSASVHAQPRADLADELTQILNEINAELAEMETKHA